MIHSKVVQQTKSTALNAIRKIYNPRYQFPYSPYDADGSCAEQREKEVRKIIENLEEDLLISKQLYKKQIHEI